MDRSVVNRRALKWAVRTLGAAALLIALLAGSLSLLDADRFRGPLVRFLAARTSREVRIEGSLKAHLLSFSPRLSADRVVIANPPWMPRGSMAEIARVSLVVDFHPFAGSSAIRSLELEGATLHLLRDSKGNSNWQWAAPGQGDGGGPPLIHSLSMPHARVDLDDARRHLQFEGKVSAGEAKQGPYLRIDGTGQLNGRAASFAINGDPLATVTADRAYRFTFAEQSSASHLAGRGSIHRPFDFRALEATFEATGEDLKDLYFLVGVSLPNTAAYRLSGKFARQDIHFTFSDLAATSGQSDLRGTLAIDTSADPSRIVADLDSQRLRLKDLGAAAAGRAPESQIAKQMLFPDTQVDLRSMRRSDAMINFHAQGVEVGGVTLHKASARVSINEGVLTAGALSAVIADGKLTGQLSIDATHDVPTESVDLRVTDLRLGQLDRKHSATPPLDGLLQAHLVLKGHGSSIHQFVASSAGTVTAVLPHGTIHASLAELSGMDLVRGLGLTLDKDAVTSVRCGVAGFQVRDGTMTAQSLVIDTDPVLITGQGTIHLDSEALDLQLRGRPKSFRLVRVRTPLAVRGTLRQPSFSVHASGPALQAGAAVALGVLFTPLAAGLAFVDPGLAKDADCSALLANAVKDETQQSPAGRRTAD